MIEEYSINTSLAYSILKSVILVSLSLCSGDGLYHYHGKEAAKKSQQWRLLYISLVYVCLSKNFSMSTEKVAKPAQPIHAAFGPPETKLIHQIP